MHFRPFRNSDPPQLAEIWNAQPAQRALACPVTPQVLEHYVFSKPYFDRDGLIVAESAGHLCGFVHVGFGPNHSHLDLDYAAGAVCMLMVRAEESATDLADLLLEQGEETLRQRGARLIYGGGIDPINPFYLGLYGGSEMPGILVSDVGKLSLFQRHGYEEIDRVIVLQRDLTDLRLPVDRRQIQLRRKYRVELDTSPPMNDWWATCTGPPSEPTRFELCPVDGGPACGNVSFWVMEPLSATWGKLSVGMNNLRIVDSLKRQGLATLLNGESLRQLQLNGVALVEVQTMQHNAAALGLYQKLGFVEVDQGIVLRKQGSSSHRPQESPHA